MERGKRKHWHLRPKSAVPTCDVSRVLCFHVEILTWFASIKSNFDSTFVPSGCSIHAWTCFPFASFDMPIGTEGSETDPVLNNCPARVRRLSNGRGDCDLSRPERLSSMPLWVVRSPTE